jgi:hypothetical protein
MRALFRYIGSWVYTILVSFGWQPRERDCEHPDAGEDGP